MEVLSEELCKTGSIVERIVKTAIHRRLDPAKVEKIVVSESLWPECVMKGGPIVHKRGENDPQIFIGDFKAEPGNIVEDFEVIMK